MKYIFTANWAISAVRDRILATFLMLSVLSLSPALGATINTDTTIDSTNSFPGESVTITDGPGGPANVTMVDGGAVGGFTVAENSVFEINGGTSTFLSSLQNNATLIMKGGTIECSEVICQVIDYDALLTANDNTQVHLFGGDGGLSLRLRDSSVLNVYGRGLALDEFATSLFVVTGSFADGSEILVSVHLLAQSAGRIVLNEIPEPPTNFAIGIGIFTALCVIDRLPRTRIRTYASRTSEFCQIKTR